MDKKEEPPPYFLCDIFHWFNEGVFCWECVGRWVLWTGILLVAIAAEREAKHVANVS